MRHTKGWRSWEVQVNDELGLDPTVASGSQFHDKGDGVDRSQSGYAYQVDAKYTESGSYSITKTMAQWTNQAARSGKKFALCVRIWPRIQAVPSDYAVIPFDDFVDLLDKARNLEDDIGG